MIKVALSH